MFFRVGFEVVLLTVCFFSCFSLIGGVRWVSLEWTFLCVPTGPLINGLFVVQLFQKSVLSDNSQRTVSAFFKLKSKSFKSHLTISKTIRDDTGKYYCGVLTLNKCEFGQGTFLLIKGTMCLHFKSFYSFIYLFFFLSN